MSIEFVEAVGRALGGARDAFGTSDAGAAPPPANPALVLGSPGGSGLAAEAASTSSSRLDSDAVTLSQLDAKTQSQASDVFASQAAGRAAADGHISGAISDVQTLAPASNTPLGRRALMTALTQRLQGAQQTLQDHDEIATTHAAASQATAAEYHAVTPYSSSGSASAVPVSGTSFGAMPLAGLGGLPGMMDPQAGGQSGDGKDPRTASAAGNSLISAVIQRALSQHGTPYVWGGGGPNGPTGGGYDCSSLMQYAFAGAGMHLPRTTYDQIGLGQAVAPGGIQAGDLIFSNFGEGGVAGPGHVQLAISPTHVVEAPHTGASVQISPIPSGHKVVRRILT